MSDDRETALEDTLIARLAESLAPVSPPGALAARLRQRLLAAVRSEAPAQPDVHLTIRATEGDWSEILPGVAMKMLREDNASRSYLLRLAPGARIPAHPHRIDEECMVLSGDVWLGAVRASAGDFHLARGHTLHGEIRSEGGCLLYLRGENYADGAQLG